MNANKPRFLAKNTTELADQVSLYFLLLQEAFVRHAVWSNVTNLAAGLDDFEIAEPDPPTEALRIDYMMMLAESAAVHLNWFEKAGRIAFSFHPDMVSNLRGSTSEKLPGSVFRHMAHSSPLLLFVRPVPTTTLEGSPAHLHGFFVYGIAGDITSPTWSICETDDEAMAAVGLMMIVSPTADLEDMEFDRVVIPLKEVFTVEDAVNETMAGYGIDENHTVVDAAAYRERSREAIVLALNMLLYICDSEADHQPMPPVRAANSRARARRQIGGATTKFIASGWVEGPDLEAADDRRRRTQAERGGSSSWEQDYHRRRGHFRTVWYGPGRTMAKPKWIKPYAVREDKADNAAARLIAVEPKRL
ncbi:hypothetical protein [Nocardia sp. NRRL S-836]|uniref:hypothetical protein n=1 Tax=Nocardia sp. NRRL S-836 TaxID=1519492 RepID=UPI0006C63812|nr:hypothetical protein [Nocardia sp. NRRL S-836]KOV84768.1 hypothetical protein ADL03_16010 [Nocardia sp. NRRL S-836]